VRAVVVEGRTLTESDETPSTVTFTRTTAKNDPAARWSIEGHAALLAEIKLSYTCTGKISGLTYTGSGDASIVANTPRLKCEDKQVLLEGDKVVVKCTGKTTSTSTPPVVTEDVASTVTVTISDAGQATVLTDG
jgi:hypothetical protein